ncbi:zinc finger CCCH domain-containing protein 13-like isoform X2 [Vespa crabro]|uniref:zinc finger CCCH domain-containing protein 13-like isoform X2 n=1 Tax=Vespa crabro TaxID=7445 RepID=UPI001F0295D5|nr:zinc finger CCCH domain-containing protein 13-like isoform X2 [Vespa crabro]
MSRQPRGERDHVSRCDQREPRDLRDFRDLRDLRDVRDVRDVRETYATGVRHHRDDYENDHHPTDRSIAASTSALPNKPDRSKGRTTVQEDRNDLQLVNLCVPSRSAIVIRITPRPCCNF